MLQRGRKSGSNVTLLPVNGDPRRLEALPGLSRDEKALFNELVQSCGPRHFVKSDLPLLVSYVQATLPAR